ncbi:uncharacterized protein LOC132553339 [Ylistrum balloti]|uniref:uncharacterized protein LOC132553339 n=1 Tax=Ylistrum balloti TaxID=509963 RepID=UPI002905E769|nr:uncharacterized protein LOC132553339 [Ylistrum balloti]
MGFTSTILASVIVTLVLGDSIHLCDDIAHLDCSSYVLGDTDEEVCDNRNVLYQNFCEYSKAKCADNSISIASLGGCYDPHRPVEIYTTTRPTIVTTTLDPISDIFCRYSGNITCSSDLAPVCASNGQLYFNKCDFALAYCKDKTLALQNTELCHH